MGTDVARTPEDVGALGDAVDSGVLEVSPMYPLAHPCSSAVGISVQVAPEYAVRGRSTQVMVHVDAEGAPYVLIPTQQLEQSLVGAVPRQRPLLNLALVAATLVTTTTRVRHTKA